MRKFRFLLLIFFTSTLPAQHLDLSKDPVFLDSLKHLANLIYNWEFEASRSFYESRIKTKIPAGHPLPDFIEAFSLYWQQYPFNYESQVYQNFMTYLDRAIAICDQYLERNEDDTEALYFKIFGLGMQTMSYVHKREYMKTFSSARVFYRALDKIKAAKAEFTDFYFITGCYNYYIEAYPDRYPIYKTLTIFLTDGDKAKGLEQLKYVCQKGVFLVPQGFNYLISIYLNYENDFKQAFHYAQKIHELYPNNLYFLFQYGVVAFFEGDRKALEYIYTRLQTAQDTLYRHSAQILKALAKVGEGNLKTAFESMQGLEQTLLKQDNSRHDLLKVFIYWIFGRYYAAADNPKQSSKYLKQAEYFDTFSFFETLKQYRSED